MAPRSQSAVDAADSESSHGSPRPLRPSFSSISRERSSPRRRLSRHSGNSRRSGQHASDLGPRRSAARLGPSRRLPGQASRDQLFLDAVDGKDTPLARPNILRRARPRGSKRPVLLGGFARNSTQRSATFAAVPVSRHPVHILHSDMFHGVSGSLSLGSAAPRRRLPKYPAFMRVPTPPAPVQPAARPGSRRSSGEFIGGVVSNCRSWSGYERERLFETGS